MKRNVTSDQSMQDRVHGCLLGAVIGAELSFSRIAKPDRFSAVKSGKDLFSVTLEPDFDWKPARNNEWTAKVTPMVGVGVEAYLAAGGRATPEDMGKVFRDHKGVAIPAFLFDQLHSIQEVLKEGMNPRISGLMASPNGLLAAAMPAVGAFHFADPERAYLDGVELASVAEPRLAADWAGLCAAAVAAAFDKDATDRSIVDAVLKTAFQNCRDVFYDINTHAAAGWGTIDSGEETFLDWWYGIGGVVPSSRQTRWPAPNPIRYVLPILHQYHARPHELMALLVATNPGEWWSWGWLGSHAVSAAIAGAICGAMHGSEIFPAQWRAWAEPIVKPWLGLAGVIGRRRGQERQIVADIQRSAKKPGKGLSRLHDRIRGAMLAGAIGNAMGSPVEGKMYWEIDKEHFGGIKTVLDPRRLESEDDNQMAMLLVETYIERDGQPVMARHFGKTWLDKLNRDHFFPLCMGNAYDNIGGGADPRITGHWSVVTGSTVMCMEPVGIYNAGDPTWAAIDATALSYMYQRGLDVTAAAMLAATVASALRADATVESVCQSALDVAPRTPLKTFDKRKFKTAHEFIATCLDIADKYDDVLAARKELYDKCLLYHMIDPLELWGFALAMFKIAKGDVRQAAIGGTNIGRDSDTIAGRAAMLAGAIGGTAGVPKEWIAMFSPASMERIDGNAARMAGIVGVSKLSAMRRRTHAFSP